jgi:uncharacterized 2Fe-2S/4Fe-4S cluster protein (DUF4445 family)
MKHNIAMCEECLQCRDPNLYCRNRSSCPIWFLQKEALKKEAPAEEESKVEVLFEPEAKSVYVSAGSTLLDAAQSADVHLNASCNGRGSCGKCKLIVESGDLEISDTPLLTDSEKAAGYVLACQTKVMGKAKVRIPEEMIVRRMRAAGMGKDETERLKGLVSEITPLQIEIQMELSPPSLDDPVSDMDRLSRGFKNAGLGSVPVRTDLRVIRELAAAMRDENWKVSVSVTDGPCGREVVAVRPGENKRSILGIAVDVGTTSIVVYLVDMKTGDILAATSGHNRQAACGDDVINRIVCAEKDGVKKLSNMALKTINDLIREALESCKADKGDVMNAVISGNTTMMHLLMGIDPRYIRREPYVPTVSEFPQLRAGELGLKIERDASVFIMPGPASYVGGDIVSGMIYSGMHREEPLTLFIDVGTNGEIVLGNRDWLMTASCSAGPAFEGGGVRWGMRAEEGAIERIDIDPGSLKPLFEVIGGGKARGICGSGMIELIGRMLITGIIDQRGKFRLPAEHPAMKTDDGLPLYVIASREETGLGEDITFSEADIDNILRSKAAVYAGFTVLLSQAGLDFSSLDRVFITGGFGKYLDVENAVVMGLLPDIQRDKFFYLGNSSIGGAYMALLSEVFRKEALEVAKLMTYIDFSSNTDFMNEFTSALFIPHTDMRAFPSVKLTQPSPDS